MTAPMPETMSPREKVELKPCPFCGGDAWLNDYEAKYSDLPPKSRCPQCRSCGASLGYLTTPNKATEAWNRRAALASSGDHAELARVLSDLRADAEGYVSVRDREGCLSGRAAFAIDRIIAENAALREQLDWMTRDRNAVIGERDRADTMMQSAETRATEAERKLAEAVGLLRVTLGDLDRRDVTAETANRIDHFISKEAERG